MIYVSLLWPSSDLLKAVFERMQDWSRQFELRVTGSVDGDMTPLLTVPNLVNISIECDRQGHIPITNVTQTPRPHNRFTVAYHHQIRSD